MHSRSAARCSSDDSPSLKAKVFLPGVFSWVKEGDGDAGLRIDTAQIRAFVQIAPVAREGKIVRVIGTAMLLSDYMLNVERRMRQDRLG